MSISDKNAVRQRTQEIIEQIEQLPFEEWQNVYGRVEDIVDSLPGITDKNRAYKEKHLFEQAATMVAFDELSAGEIYDAEKRNLRMTRALNNPPALVVFLNAYGLSVPYDEGCSR